MKTRLLVLLMLCLAATAGAFELEWSGSGREGEILISRTADADPGDEPVECVIALPATGNWRVRAVQIDGVPVEPVRVTSIVAPRVLRRARVGTLEFVSNDPEWREARIRVAFDGSLPAVGPAQTDPILRRTLINPRQTSRVTPSADDRAAARDIFDGSSRFLRIDVEEPGVYSLGYEDLLEAGVTPGADMSTFRLTGAFGESQPFRLGDPGGSWERDWEPKLVPMQILGGGTFNVETEIRFYATGLDGFTSDHDPAADWEDYRRNPYALWDTYILAWGGAGGASVGTGDATPQGGDPVIDRLPVRLHEERNYVYARDILFEDGWAWKYYTESAAPAPYLLNLSGLPPFAADTDLRMRIGFDAEKSGGFDHRIQGYLGPQRDEAHLVLDSDPFSITSSVAMAVHEGTIPVPADLVGATSSIFHFVMPADMEGSDFGYLLWFQLFYDTPAATSGSAPLNIHVPANGARTSLTVSGWTAEPVIWDVTDPAAVSVLTGAAWSDGEITLGLATAERRHLILVDPANGGGFATPARLRAINPAPLRNDEVNPDMIVVHYDDFAAAARTYAAHRSNRFPSATGAGVVEVVSVGDVYANFGNGMQDVAALRNFLKYRYDAPDSRLTYVLLLGDASSDYRNFLQRDTTGDGTSCLVPALSDRFRVEQSLDTDYTTDDYICQMDLADDQVDLSLLDLAVGRLPAETAAQAAEMVARVIDYDENDDFSLWRNRIVIAADDYNKPHGNIDSIDHTLQADRLATDCLPPEFDIEKIYMCEYEMEPGEVKIKAQVDLLESLSDGVLLFNFVGHGGGSVLADEKLLLTQSLPSLTNAGRKFLFISSSCNVGLFDNPTVASMTEEMFTVDNGGAIATLAATALSNAHNNSRWHQNVLKTMFPAAGDETAVPLGLAMVGGKAATQLGSYGKAIERYVQLGDPSMTLAAPELGVEIETVPADTLRVGDEMVVRGRVVDGGELVADFEGEVMLSVRASDDTTGCVKPSSYGEDSWTYYHKAGPEVYRGRVLISGGEFESPRFFIPGLSAAAIGSYGRVRAYAVGGDTDAAGVIEGMEVVPGILPSEDTPPEVDLTLAGGATSGAPGMAIHLTAEAAAGINMLGTRPHNSIFLEYVEMGEVENLTERFEYDLGSATCGSAASTLPMGLDEGLNTIVASVADNLGNVGHDTLQVRVMAEGVVDLLNVQPFPNPFAELCMVGFETTAPADVTCGIYTITGRRIVTLELGCADAGRYSFVWDGRDGGGDPVGNGTYLYRLKAVYRDDPDRVRECTGALVKIGD